MFLNKNTNFLDDFFCSTSLLLMIQLCFYSFYMLPFTLQSEVIWYPSLFSKIILQIVVRSVEQPRNLVPFRTSNLVFRPNTISDKVSSTSHNLSWVSQRGRLQSSSVTSWRKVKFTLGCETLVNNISSKDTACPILISSQSADCHSMR